MRRVRVGEGPGQDPRKLSRGSAHPGDGVVAGDDGGALGHNAEALREEQADLVADAAREDRRHLRGR